MHTFLKVVSREWKYTYHMALKEQIAPLLKGDVHDDEKTRKEYSRDTSIFERIPALVVFPKDASDVEQLVRFVREERETGADITLTARSAGTDMTGGSLTTSIAVVFTKYMNHVLDIREASPPDEATATTEPGVYYRDFEKATLAKAGVLLPSFPASRELCAMGGIVNNNSAGELTLQYGKTNRYVRSIDVILSDGTRATMRPITLDELARKKREPSLEASIYREIHRLIQENREEIERARPTVSKNSAGYALWDVLDEKQGRFDLTQLLCGAQGTLALMSQATLGLVKPKKHKAMLVVFLSDYESLPEIVQRVLAQRPESFESYDNKTFGLAIKFMWQMLMQLGLFQAIKLGVSFLPEVWMALTGGVPKLILLAEFTEDSPEEALEKVRATRDVLQGLPLQTKVCKSEAETVKYWKVRREAFALLRKRMKGLYAAPIMDDFVVHPKDYPTFLPELYTLLGNYKFTYAVTGHIGDGNFHIFPLVDMSKPEVHTMIMELMPKIYALVQKYGGSITGEHNDGIVRTPYLSYQFSPTMLELFAEVKKIWDPAGVFNPGKKVGGTIADIERDMVTHV
jgi:FAD/FMN-containing dehydrogenase